MTIGQSIWTVRKQRSITQARLGKLCDVSSASIANYEKRATLPKRRVVEKLAAALGVPPDRLVESVPSAPCQETSSRAPLYDSVLAVLKELYGAAEALVKLRRRTGLSKAEMARRSGMSEVHLHQVLSGRRNPSRDRLLALCIGADASLEETQQVLRLGGWAQPYPKLRRYAIIHGIVYHRELNEINDTLFEENEKALS